MWWDYTQGLLLGEGAYIRRFTVDYLSTVVFICSSHYLLFTIGNSSF
jgi:hypothetical protein